jgi:hypothetical protein
MKITSENFETQAYKVVCNSLSIEIMFQHLQDRVYYKYSDESKVKFSKIYYTSNGNPYFMIKGTREHLNGYMRVKINL